MGRLFRHIYAILDGLYDIVLYAGIRLLKLNSTIIR